MPKSFNFFGGQAHPIFRCSIAWPTVTQSGSYFALLIITMSIQPNNGQIVERCASKKNASIHGTNKLYNKQDYKVSTKQTHPCSLPLESLSLLGFLKRVWIVNRVSNTTASRVVGVSENRDSSNSDEIRLVARIACWSPLTGKVSLAWFLKPFYVTRKRIEQKQRKKATRTFVNNSSHHGGTFHLRIIAFSRTKKTLFLGDVQKDSKFFVHRTSGLQEKWNSHFLVCSVTCR